METPAPVRRSANRQTIYWRRSIRDEYRRLASKLRTVPLTHLLEMQRVGEPVRHVYFPGSGVCSVTTIMRDGRMVEVGTIGREGVVNFGVFFAPDAIQAFATIVQVPGDSAQVLSANAFLEEMERRAGCTSRCGVMRRHTRSSVCRRRRAPACTVSKSGARNGC